MNPMDETPWMIPAEIATYTRRGRKEVLSALADGSLRGYQRVPGGRWTAHRDDVDAWVRGEPPTRTVPQYTRGRAS